MRTVHNGWFKGTLQVIVLDWQPLPKKHRPPASLSHPTWRRWAAATTRQSGLVPLHFWEPSHPSIAAVTRTHFFSRQEKKKNLGKLGPSILMFSLFSESASLGSQKPASRVGCKALWGSRPCCDFWKLVKSLRKRSNTSGKMQGK